MKTLILSLVMLTLPLGASAQSTTKSVKCLIAVDRTKTVVDPTTFYGRTTDEDCDNTRVFRYKAGAENENEINKAKLLRECAISHTDCVVSSDTMSGNSYPGSEQGAFQAQVCVTGTRVKIVDLSAQEIFTKQCEKIDLCIQDALSSGDDKLYQMAKDLYSMKKCEYN